MALNDFGQAQHHLKQMWQNGFDEGRWQGRIIGFIWGFMAGTGITLIVAIMVISR